MGPIAWSRPELDLDTLTPKQRPRPDRPRPPGARHPRGRLDRRRRLRPRPGARGSGGTATPPASWPRRARAARDRRAPSSRPTRCSTAAADRRPRLRPAATSVNPINPYGASKLSGEIGSPRRAAGPPPRDPPHLVAPRPARQRLPREDRPRRAPGPGRRPAAQGRRGRGRRADLDAGPRRRDRRADRRGRARRPRARRAPRSTTSSTPAARPAPTGPARSSGRPASTSPVVDVPGSTWQRASTPPRVGRPRAHAAPVGRADARLARRLRPRGPGAGAFAQHPLTHPDSTAPRPSPPVPGRKAHGRPDLPVSLGEGARGDAGGARITGLDPARHAAPAEPRIAHVPGRPRRRRPRDPAHVRAARRPRGAGRDGAVKVAIIVGATHGATAGLPLERGRGLPRGDQVLDQRRPGLQPQRDGGEGAHRGRRARRSSSTWATATAGRARTPSTPTTRPRTASGSTPTSTATAGSPTTRTSTTASRGSGTCARRPTRSCCCSTSATRRATPSPATPTRPSRRPSSASTTTAAGFLRAGLPGGHRDRPQPRPVLHRAACSRPARRSTSCSATPPTRTTTSHLRVGADPGLPVPDGPRPARRLLPLGRRQAVAADPGRHGRRVRRHVRRPRHDAGPGQRQPGRGRRAGVRLGRVGRRRARIPSTTLGTDAKVRVDAQEATAWRSTGRRSTGCTPAPSRAGCGLVARPSRRPGARASGTSTTAAGRSRPNGDGAQDALPLKVELSEPADWTLRIRDDGGRHGQDLHRRRRAGRRLWAPAAGSVDDGGVPLVASRRPTPGATARSATTATSRRHPRRRTCRSPTPTGATPIFTPERRRLWPTRSSSPPRRTEPGSVTGTVRDAGDAVGRPPCRPR